MCRPCDYCQWCRLCCLMVRHWYHWKSFCMVQGLELLHRFWVQFPLSLWGFFRVESHQWPKHWYPSGYPARCLTLRGLTIVTYICKGFKTLSNLSADWHARFQDTFQCDMYARFQGTFQCDMYARFQGTFQCDMYARFQGTFQCDMQSFKALYSVTCKASKHFWV